MSRKQETIEIDLTILNYTDQALRVTDGDNYCWIPKSLIKNYDDSFNHCGITPTMEIPVWFAEKSELI